MPELPPSWITIQKIRGCESEVAARIVLEGYALAYGEAVREACAKVCWERAQSGPEAMTTEAMLCAAAIRGNAP